MTEAYAMKELEELAKLMSKAPVLAKTNIAIMILARL